MAAFWTGAILQSSSFFLNAPVMISHDDDGGDDGGGGADDDDGDDDHLASFPGRPCHCNLQTSQTYAVDRRMLKFQPSGATKRSASLS